MYIAKSVFFINILGQNCLVLYLFPLFVPIINLVLTYVLEKSVKFRPSRNMKCKIFVYNVIQKLSENITRVKVNIMNYCIY